MKKILLSTFVALSLYSSSFASSGSDTDETSQPSAADIRRARLILQQLEVPDTSPRQDHDEFLEGIENLGATVEMAAPTGDGADETLSHTLARLMTGMDPTEVIQRTDALRDLRQARFTMDNHLITGVFELPQENIAGLPNFAAQLAMPLDNFDLVAIAAIPPGERNAAIDVIGDTVNTIPREEILQVVTGAAQQPGGIAGLQARLNDPSFMNALNNIRTNTVLAGSYTEVDGVRTYHPLPAQYLLAMNLAELTIFSGLVNALQTITNGEAIPIQHDLIGDGNGQIRLAATLIPAARRDAVVALAQQLIQEGLSQEEAVQVALVIPEETATQAEFPRFFNSLRQDLQDVDISELVQLATEIPADDYDDFLRTIGTNNITDLDALREVMEQEGGWRASLGN